MYTIFPRFLTSLCLIYISIGHAYGNSKCGKSEYKSNFLSGACIKCPQRVKDCKKEEIDDARRCFIACSGGRISTIQPSLSSTAVPQVKILVTVTAGTSTKNSTHIKETFSTQQVLSDKRSSRKYYNRHTLSTLSSDVRNKWTDNSNRFYEVIFSLVALVFLVIGCFVFLFWWKKKRNTTGAPIHTYNAVTHGPISNSEQSTSGAFSSNTDGVAITTETNRSLSDMYSSSEEFERSTPETKT